VDDHVAGAEAGDEDVHSILLERSQEALPPGLEHRGVEARPERAPVGAVGHRGEPMALAAAAPACDQRHGEGRDRAVREHVALLNERLASDGGVADFNGWLPEGACGAPPPPVLSKGNDNNGQDEAKQLNCFHGF